MEECVKSDLERMFKIGVITPVSEPSEWVSQMVAARKKDCSIRICIDPRDLNKALRRPHHPMRSVKDVASCMPNATVFSTLDARSGLWQINLEHESSLLTTFSTPFRRYRFLSMLCGITSALEVSSVQWKSCLLGIPVLSFWVTYWYGEKELWSMMLILGKFYSEEMQVSSRSSTVKTHV